MATGSGRIAPSDSRTLPVINIGRFMPGPDGSNVEGFEEELPLAFPDPEERWAIRACESRAMPANAKILNSFERRSIVPLLVALAAQARNLDLPADSLKWYALFHGCGLKNLVCQRIPRITGIFEEPFHEVQCNEHLG